MEVTRMDNLNTGTSKEYDFILDFNKGAALVVGKSNEKRKNRVHFQSLPNGGLVELLKTVQEESALYKFTTQQKFERILKVLSPYQLTAVYEDKTKQKNQNGAKQHVRKTVVVEEQSASGDSGKKIAELLGEFQGKHNRISVNNIEIGRIIICKKKSLVNEIDEQQKNKENYKNENAACVGSIFTFSDLKLICYPARSAVENNKANSYMRMNIDKYRIYELIDGTLINLYYYGKWFISTGRGFYMNDMKWMSDKTYEQMVKELLEKCGTSFGDLNKNYCYSFVFRHPSHHLFNIKNSGMWLIQIYDNVSREILYNCYDVENTAAPDAAFVEKFRRPKRLFENMSLNFSDINSMCESALDKFISSDGEEAVLGFIFRNEKILNNDGFCFIKSILYKAIEQYIYDFKGLDKVIDYTNRFDYICLRAFLNYSSSDTFKSIFPNISLAKYEKLICNTLPILLKREYTKRLEKLAKISDRKDREKISAGDQDFRGKNIKLSGVGVKELNLARSLYNDPKIRGSISSITQDSDISVLIKQRSYLRLFAKYLFEVENKY